MRHVINRTTRTALSLNRRPNHHQPIAMALMERLFPKKASLPPPLETARGVKFQPLWRLVPWLAPLYTDYETRFNGAPAFLFLCNNTWIPLVATAMYLAFCYAGPKLMRDHKPFDLKVPLALWNLSLAVVSAIGAFRVGSHLLYLLSPVGGYSFRDTICEPPEASYADNATGLWCVVFTVSKLLELGDTAFVVLRKKPLIFLHWYHHATVLICSWYGHITFTPALYFTSINFSVHAVMYAYFFLMALHAVPRFFNPKWLTIAQISQMFVGLYVIGASTYYKFYSASGCAIEPGMVAAIWGMYSTYLVLFVDFFVKRYLKKAARKAVATKTVAADQEEGGEFKDEAEMAKYKAQ